MLFLQNEVTSFDLEFCPVSKTICLFTVTQTHTHTHTLARTGRKLTFPASEAAAYVGYIVFCTDI